MLEEKAMEKNIYKETINFGNNSFMEFLMTKTRAFKEFQKMSAFVTSIYRGSNYPFFVVDTNLSIQYMNPACLEFTGLKLTEISGKVFCPDILESDLCEGDCAIKRAITTKRPVVGKRVNVKDKNGKRHTIIVSAGALVDMSGEVLGGFEMWRDAMPDMEMTSRVNLLMSTLDDYCREMRELLEKLDDILAHEIGKSGGGKQIINQMKQRMGTLMNMCHTLQRSDCWNVMDCPNERQIQCPAFPNEGRNCWDVDYTWCNGQMQGKALDKTKTCTQCRVYMEFRERN
ncbi:MAG TPA: PAS domain S-box protein [Syntrophales bacterium]|nr:PAS domain S-box protein [Syntrophales bacterium]